MLMALLHPDEVDRLVIVDIAPAANPPNLLAYIRAMRAVDLRGVTRRAEADVALAGAVPDPAERAFLLQNLVIDENAAHWRLNLETIERDFPQIVGFPDLPAGTAYPGPALFVAGARSNYIQPQHEPGIRRLFPQSPDNPHRGRRALGSCRAAASLPADRRSFPFRRCLMLPHPAGSGHMQAPPVACLPSAISLHPRPHPDRGHGRVAQRESTTLTS